jgi:Tfp pilus assembly protein PilF
MATPDDPRLLGVRALAREELDLARLWLERAVEEMPDDPDAHAYLGCTLLAVGEVASGMEETETALRLSPDGFASNLKAGELALRLGDPTSAEARFLKALRAVAPGTADAAATKALLAEARRRARASIPHEVSLPSRRWPRWFRRAGRPTVPMSSPNEAGGTIG